MSEVKVWREGERIRQTDGVGYIDTVGDKKIWEHLSEHVRNFDVDSVAFCAAVLRLRRSERGAR